MSHAKSGKPLFRAQGSAYSPPRNGRTHMNILVIGGGGMVGVKLINRLAAKANLIAPGKKT